MKRKIIQISVLFAVGLSHAQTTTENYIQSRTYLEAVTITSPDAKQINTVQYFDGLGRPKQVVSVKASPLGKDVVSHIEYDTFGRQTKNYLPVPQGGTLNGAIVSTPLANASQPELYGTEKIYSESILENSPLDRVLQQKQVGTAWNDKPVNFSHDAVTVADAVKKFTTSTTWENGATKSIPSNAGLYQDSQLYKNAVTDEDGNKTIEFKNGKGQLILARKVVSTSENADTYYVYNEYDQLAFVVSPLLAKIQSWSQADQDNLAYEYRYDGRGRLVEKKLPGKGWEFMVYDKADRLILSQDANLKKQNKWLITKYDQFGRVAYTGFLTGGERAARQSEINNLVITESRNPTGFTRNGMTAYYTDNYFVGEIPTILSVNYYDTYPSYLFNPTFPAAIFGEPLLTDNGAGTGKSTKGLPVMSLVKNIEDDNWTKSYIYYDTKGRSVGSYSINHLGGYTKTESQLDFAGVPKSINTVHVRKIGEPGISVNERFIYDTQNRLFQHYHQVDSKPEELLVENSYNEISQLKNKKVGNNLQSIDYTYNIRGWMTDINKDQMAVPDLGGKLFSYKIKYNQKQGITNPDTVLFSGKNVAEKYNGNIAEVDWRAVESLGANPPIDPKRYGYAYDKLNRLTAGYYQNPSNPGSKENTESIDYDLNGNITNLYRTSVLEGGTTTTTVIDNLEYTYLGNQAIRIKDNSRNKSGYEGVAGYPITYDLNGNMESMLDKELGIGYNYLNLANDITIGSGQVVTDIKSKYSANGVKVRKENTKTSIGFAGIDYTKDITDYLDGFQYLNKTSSSNGGGGSSETFSILLETNYALEQQAFSITERKVVPPPITKTPDLQFFPTAEGFYDYTQDQYIYQYNDHLGNVRMSFARNTQSQTVEIMDGNDYYPFGMNHLKTGNAMFGVGKYQNYKYNGKELQETGMYDYGARMYMPDLGRWGVIDQLAEKYRRWSPYNYAMNNPILFIDPDGRDIIIHYKNSKGKLMTYDYKTGSTYKGNNTFIKNFYKSVATLKKNNADGIINSLESHKEKIIISQTSGSSSASYTEKEIQWNDKQGIETNKSASLTPTLVLNHEGDHMLDALNNPKQHAENSQADKDNPYSNKEEERVIKGSEQETAKKLGLIEEGEITRDDHGGHPYKASDVNEKVSPSTSTFPKIEEVIITVPKKNKNGN